MAKTTDTKRTQKGCLVRSDLRLALYLRDRFACAYCGRDLHGAAPDQITLDHIRPASQGGDNDPANVVTACRSCNCGRQDKPWRSYATQGAVERIQRLRRRSITRYRTLARHLIADGHRPYTVTPEAVTAAGG